MSLTKKSSDFKKHRTRSRPTRNRLLRRLVNMRSIPCAVLSALFCTAVSASLKVKEEHRTVLYGEDIHINIPPGDGGEVVFESKSSPQLVLFYEGKVVDKRGGINSLGHLVLEDVQKEDEGTYVVKDNNKTIRHLILKVRDCSVELVVKYGDTFSIPLNHVEGPITLEFRRGLIQHSNHTDTLTATEAPPVLLYNRTAVLLGEYVGRLSVSEKRVTLHSVWMADEGSFTVRDREGKVRRRICLNVREHQDFLHVAYGSNLKMKLYTNPSNLNVVYKPKSDNQDRAVLVQGALLPSLDPLLDGRVTVEGSELEMKKLHMSDSGVFILTDLAGFTVAHVYIDVEAYKLPPLTVAILSMLGLIAFMLLVCLLSCVYKVHKRNLKNKKLTLLAQQAGKGEGEAFRQVVHEAYTRFTEESLMQSACENPPEGTEVTIKGLEVSKPGRYQALTSDTTLLEMSDSGVEFAASGLPLDSDTDGAMTYPSHKPLLNAVYPTAVSEGSHSVSPEATTLPGGGLSASGTPDSALSASPASNPRSVAAATPDGTVAGAASPGEASRETLESASASPDGAAESAEAVQKEESAQST
ncbi:uncharacterized protein LOC128756953 isoform X2 [Synchiropus splendidus]|uniref:uncharacterized protein LOC128756953 isoform X2 n=1 Tax=Synchiropus splendidus TaxID=270530 RepID=UPI00237D5480|nr:uncharacterized protein LOC128756953 isoform X2 [Synchiropus splendidus]